MLRNYLKVVLVVLMLSTTISCKVNKEQFGNYETQTGKTVVYDKGKDVYLFWDKISLNKVEDNMQIQDYEKITKRNFFDNIIYYGTFGVFSFYTVKIKVKEDEKINNQAIP